jgi:hypothetical protein
LGGDGLHGGLHLRADFGAAQALVFNLLEQCGAYLHGQWLA